MLILKRKIGESLMIGEDVEITILEREGDTIKLGVSAPRSIRVFRKEIYEEIKAENQTALQHPIGFDELRKLFQQNMKKEGK